MTSIVPNSIVYKLYKLFLFLLFLNSMYPWYMWNNSLGNIIRISSFALSIILIISKKQYFSINTTNIIIFVSILFLALWEILTKNELLLGRTIISITIASLIFLRDELKIEILNSFTKSFTILLSISLFFYILFLINILSFTPDYIEFKDVGYKAFNYYFFILPANIYDLDTYYRFRSIFAEPGHLTMGVIPMIMAYKFDLKNKYIRMLLIIELFTFSLAGYITLFIGYFLINFSNKNIWKYMIIGIICILSSISILNQLGFSDMLDKLLWDRLEYSNGDIAGNNRVTPEFDMVYKNFMNTSFKWYGNKFIDIGDFEGISGIKKYLVMHGIIGVFIVFIFYSIYAIIKRSYIHYIFSIILLLLLFQNAYPFWTCILSMYILGVENLKRKSYV